MALRDYKRFRAIGYTMFALSLTSFAFAVVVRVANGEGAEIHRGGRGLPIRNAAALVAIGAVVAVLAIGAFVSALGALRRRRARYRRASPNGSLEAPTRVPATAEAWKHEPFSDGVPVAYAARFTDREFLKLRDGLVPTTMEDKWFVHYEAPHLFFHRSWTGLPVYRVKLEETGDGAMVAEALWATRWAMAEDADPTYQAKLLDFLISTLLLERAKPFPRPDALEEAVPGVFQHRVAGTGHREES